MSLRLPLKRVRQGFTLIELLVVIAIIAILAAILFPVFQKVRENARRAACSSNEKQLSLAFLQYNQDYDETFPVGVAGDHSGIGWAGQIYPFVKSTAVYVCPDDARYSAVSPDSLVSYAINLGVPRNSYNGVSGSLPAMNAPARTVLLCEVSGVPARPSNVGTDLSVSYNNYSASTEGYGVYTYPGYGLGGVLNTGYLGGQNSPSDWAYWQIQAYPGHVTGCHSDGSNFMMADGHVKWYRGAAVSSGNNAADPTAPQKGASASYLAEGTQYSGPGAHAVTFSVN